MSIVTYADLESAVADWIGRGDLSARIPDFITLFEAWVGRRLRVRQQDTTVDLTTVNGVVALPSDYLMWRRVTWTGVPFIDLKYLEPSAFRIYHPFPVAGIPVHFSIEGANILTSDWDDTTGAIELEYFQKTTALATTLNWLYTAHPDAYLFGVLTEAYGFQQDAQNMATWGSRRNDVFDEIEALDIKSRGPGRIVVDGPTP